MKFRSRWILAAVAIIGVAACIWLWPAIRAVMKIGLPNGPEMHKYEGTNRDNLNAIRLALVLYHENEDRFPDASGWMDAIEKQIKTNDLTPEEAAKKLHNPNVKSPGPDAYGYAINDAVAGKYRGDIKDQKTVMVYETDDLARNAHGDPKKAPRGTGIALDGTILNLK